MSVLKRLLRTLDKWLPPLIMLALAILGGVIMIALLLENDVKWHVYTFLAAFIAVCGYQGVKELFLNGD